MHPVGTPGQASGLPQIGHILGGKYEIVRLLGEGGMAFVFEASHQRLHQRVAIKILTPEFARDPELVARFEREARAVARLRTKHVARVMDVDATPTGIPYIVMEFLEGRDLDAELQERTRLPVGEAVDIVLQASAGMLEAHGMGIVHRDLKPANLFLTTDRDGEERFVKVLDFGISKVVGEATRLTGAGAVMGTVLYMSPEQVRAQPNVDTRADIWALGVILYETLAGRAPWEGNSHQIAASIVSNDPPDIRTFASLPDVVATTVHKMLQRDPSRRHATVRDVLASLAPFAPPASIGAAVADQIVNGTSGGRARPQLPPDPTRTIPMTSRPSALEAASLAARAAHHAQPNSSAALLPRVATTPLANVPAIPLPPASRMPPSARTRSRARLVLVFAIAIGLVGATGVVLILVAMLHKAPPPSIAADAASSTRIGRSQPSSAEPPPTGTTGRAPTAGETASGRSPLLHGGPSRRGPDAGAQRTPPAPSSSSPPSLL
jgi:serine/threonine-protein kinase